MDCGVYGIYVLKIRKNKYVATLPKWFCKWFCQ